MQESCNRRTCSCCCLWVSWFSSLFLSTCRVTVFTLFAAFFVPSDDWSMAVEQQGQTREAYNAFLRGPPVPGTELPRFSVASALSGQRREPAGLGATQDSIVSFSVDTLLLHRHGAVI